MSLIDVRDLARWLVAALEGACPPGIYDAVANRGTLQDHLAVAREVAGHTGLITYVDDDWLRAAPGWPMTRVVIAGGDIPRQSPMGLDLEDVGPATAPT